MDPTKYPIGSDNFFMKIALQLASRGAGWTNPNPMVGAVLVRDGEIIGEGWHTTNGGLHAEREALRNCEQDTQGATIYVTLEPCCHHGKTPPCTDAILEAGISRVVVGAPDPNPLVAGKGIQILRDAGIEVTENVLLDECLAINEVFFHYIKNKMPFIVAKYAMTLDGKIATRTGASRWITSEAAREKVHRDRHRYAAIMVGIGTVLEDDPELTSRIDGAITNNPLRIVVDSSARIPLDSKLVTTAQQTETLIATTTRAPQGKLDALRDAGCEVFVSPTDQVELATLFSFLAEERGIDSILVEGGATLLWSLFDQGFVNKLQTYIAPKVFGGTDAPTPVQGEGVSLPSEAFLFSKPVVTQLGDDVLLECEVKSCSRES